MRARWTESSASARSRPLLLRARVEAGGSAVLGPQPGDFVEYVLRLPRELLRGDTRRQPAVGAHARQRHAIIGSFVAENALRVEARGRLFQIGEETFAHQHYSAVARSEVLPCSVGDGSLAQHRHVVLIRAERGVPI